MIKYSIGSDDGFIRIWAYSETSNTLNERFKISIVDNFSIKFFLEND